MRRRRHPPRRLPRRRSRHRRHAPPAPPAPAAGETRRLPKPAAGHRRRSEMRPQLFASDLHLDSEAPWAIDAFLAFLDGPARGAEALYLLGDLFEVWVGDDDDNPDNARVCAGLTALTASGVAVYVIHGNRDFLLGEEFARAHRGQTTAGPGAGGALRRAPRCSATATCSAPKIPRTSNCAASCGGPAGSSAFSRCRWRRAASSPAPRAPAARRTPSAPFPTIMDVNPEAVTLAFRATGARRLIHGHTHRPAVHPGVVDGVNAERVVLAPWYEAASCVAVDAERRPRGPAAALNGDIPHLFGRAGVEAQLACRARWRARLRARRSISSALGDFRGVEFALARNPGRSRSAAPRSARAARTDRAPRPADVSPAAGNARRSALRSTRARS